MRKIISLVIAFVMALSFAIPTFAAPLHLEEDYIVLTEEYVRANSLCALFENEGASPCFSGVITKCQQCNTYTVNMVCQGVYYETLKDSTPCSSHTNCEIKTDLYWAGGRCTQCDQYYYLPHPEYHVHWSNGVEIYKVRCCYYCY